MSDFFEVFRRLGEAEKRLLDERFKPLPKPEFDEEKPLFIKNDKIREEQ